MESEGSSSSRGRKRKDKGKEKEKDAKKMRVVTEEGNVRSMDMIRILAMPVNVIRMYLTDFGYNPLDIKRLCMFAASMTKRGSYAEASTFIEEFCSNYKFWKGKFVKDFGESEIPDFIRESTKLADWTRAYKRRFFKLQRDLPLLGVDLLKSRKSKTGSTSRIKDAEEGIERAIKMGVNVNSRNNNGDTILSFASKAGYANMVSKLLNANADPNVRNRGNGYTPLIWATEGLYEFIDVSSLSLSLWRSRRNPERQSYKRSI